MPRENPVVAVSAPRMIAGPPEFEWLGGGIANLASDPTISGCTFTGNTAANADGIYPHVGVANTIVATRDQDMSRGRWGARLAWSIVCIDCVFLQTWGSM